MDGRSRPYDTMKYEMQGARVSDVHNAGMAWWRAMRWISGMTPVKEYHWKVIMSVRYLSLTSGLRVRGRRSRSRIAV